MTVKLSNLNSDMLAEIAHYLSESDQRSLRLVNKGCNQSLETEQLWREKCQSKYPDSEKTQGVTWRNHFISCYTDGLPSRVAYREGMQRGRDLSPTICAKTALIAILVANMVYSIQSVLKHNEQFFEQSPPPRVRSFVLRAEGLCLIPILGLSSYIITRFFGPYQRIFNRIGQTSFVRNLCGSVWGSLRYYQMKFFHR
jgi:hypothetical protein